MHLDGGSTLDTRLADGSLLNLSQQTDYPWDGKITLTVQNAPAREFALRLRIPAWVERPAIRLNGQPAAIECRPGSYASLQRRWQRGDRVELDLPMEATLIESHPLVEETRGQAALMRGPIVYCLESVDLPPGVRLDDVRLPRDGRWTAHHDRVLLGGVTVLEGKAMVASAAGPAGGLYRKLPSGTAACPAAADSLLCLVQSRPVRNERVDSPGVTAEGSQYAKGDCPIGKNDAVPHIRGDCRRGTRRRSRRETRYPQTRRPLADCRRPGKRRQERGLAASRAAGPAGRRAHCGSQLLGRNAGRL